MGLFSSGGMSSVNTYARLKTEENTRELAKALEGQATVAQQQAASAQSEAARVQWCIDRITELQGEVARLQAEVTRLAGTDAP